MKKTGIILLPLIGILVLTIVYMAPTFATLECVDESTETDGATTITWESSFEDLDYTLGDPIILTVTWTVVEGVAAYEDFDLRRPQFTPKGPDPADGEIVTSASVTDTSVTLEFKFTALHWSEEDQADIGNAHFKLYLWIDTDGDETVDTLAGYGVNVHVEDPLNVAPVVAELIDLIPVPTVIPATVDIDPDTLNLKSNGKWVTAYIELPIGYPDHIDLYDSNGDVIDLYYYSVDDIDVGSISLIVDDYVASVDPDAPTEIGNYDDDGFPDLMVKFDRADVSALLTLGDEVEITITGELVDGPPFEGSDTIRVISEGKA